MMSMASRDRRSGEFSCWSVRGCGHTCGVLLDGSDRMLGIVMLQNQSSPSARRVHVGQCGELDHTCGVRARRLSRYVGADDDNW